jgi:hypothetical protein
MADLLMRMPFQYEPKKKNRFILTFDSSLGINSWYVEKASRPSIKIDTKEIKFLNTETYVAGSFAWDTISRQLRR